MRTLVYACLILEVCLSSCGTHKSSIKSGEHRTEDRTTAYGDSSLTVIQTVKTDELQSVEIIETSTIVYDTSKPVDSLTGKRPVLSESCIITRKENASKGQETVNVEAARKIEGVTNSKMEENKQTEVNRETEVNKPGISYYNVIFVILFVLIIFMWKYK